MSEEQKRLEDDLMNYEDKWVAILEDEDRVVGSGDTPIQAKAEAELRVTPKRRSSRSNHLVSSMSIHNDG